jgi:S-formylglutathione hydrolase FrmB
LEEWKSIFGYEIESALDLAGSEHDLFALAKANKEGGKLFPKLYLWCGLEDTLVDINYAYDAHLNALDVPHVFKTSEGNHTWKWWDLHIQNGVNYILNKD